MTVVFVHGNPETDAIWGPLIAELGRTDVVRLSPPGFGAPVPAGFGATVTDYRDWLIGELAAIGEPVHLVGHDWGGGHVVNVAMSRPDLLRSWTTDVIVLFDPDHVWHHLAQIWQTPDKGEEHLAGMLGGTEAQRTEGMTALGMPHEVAARVAAGQDPEMIRCILALYRSAAQPAMAEAGRNLAAAAARPGLCVLAGGDRIAGGDDNGRRRARDLGHRSAARAGARVEVLEGLGHWWMVQDPKAGAEVIGRFLDEVDG